MNTFALGSHRRTWLHRIHIDIVLLAGLLTLMGVGLFVLFSASGQDWAQMQRQATRLVIGFIVMFTMAQIPPLVYQRVSFLVYLAGLGMLVAVLLFGDMGKGAQRWLDLGLVRFQPSEIMKLAVPMMVAWFISQHPLPPLYRTIFAAFAIVLAPTLLIAKQPDLGTSLLVASSGLFAVFLAGMSWRLISWMLVAGGGFTPLMWFFLMKDYQKQRVLTFLDPGSDPLGAGYHIIQSQIAIGSGGLEGKGWLQGTQSQLEFLPERHTDFIFAVFSEEFGLLGVIGLLAIYLFIIARGLLLAAAAQDAYSRLLAGSITLTFFVYVFVNMGMVSGILPVVGVPLPLVSYGGTSMVTLMAGFGILMSIATHQRFLAR